MRFPHKVPEMRRLARAELVSFLTHRLIFRPHSRPRGRREWAEEMEWKEEGEEEDEEEEG